MNSNYSKYVIRTKLEWHYYNQDLSPKRNTFNKFLVVLDHEST